MAPALTVPASNGPGPDGRERYRRRPGPDGPRSEAAALTAPALTAAAGGTLTPGAAEPVAGELATMAFLVVFRLLINDFF